MTWLGWRRVERPREAVVMGDNEGLCLECGSGARMHRVDAARSRAYLWYVCRYV